MSRPLKSVAAIAALLVGFTASSHSPTAAQSPQPQSWPEMKCARYKQAWSDAIAHRGTDGLSREFIERHDAFTASGCTSQGDVCPRSEEELNFANMMVIAAMNAGTASTFPPFACRK
jgi:hypothetical protein